MDFFNANLGSLADCAAAIASILGAVVSIYALKTALAANRTADAVRRDAKDFSEESSRRDAARDDRERARERRILAGSVAAWWAADHTSSDRRYGVVISNQSTVNAVFHDVVVTVELKGVPAVLRVVVLPPGRFFIQQRFEAGKSTYDGIPRVVRAEDEFDPFTVAQDRSIRSIEYYDGAGTRWSWRPNAGLIEHEPPDAG